ncbi:MAG: FAD binding domain-containing protein [Acidobacteriota bacterium]
MMRPFDYARPDSLDQAVKLLAGTPGEAVVLAGGTDLLATMKDGAMTPARLVSLDAIDGLAAIEETRDGGLRIGARVTLAQLLDNTRLVKAYPGIAQAAAGITSPQIRNRGTVGGDLCQRPRCWYFRNGYGLLALREGRSMVVDGDNRYHAIFGNDGPAAFVSASSLAPVLAASQASVQVTGPDGPRSLPVVELFRIPRADGERELSLAPAEIVTAVTLPPAEGRQSSTYEVRQRLAMDWPLVAASAVLTMDGDIVEAARIVMGHVAPVPWPAPDGVGRFLRGKPVVARTAEVAAEQAVVGARALSHNDYKIRLARVCVKRALLRAAGEAVV